MGKINTLFTASNLCQTAPIKSVSLCRGGTENESAEGPFGCSSLLSAVVVIHGGMHGISPFKMVNDSHLAYALKCFSKYDTARSGIISLYKALKTIFFSLERKLV